jgi:uncharacterized protein YcaQ
MNNSAITLDCLRRFAVAHSLFTPTTLKRAFDRLGFVQADPIRAPARAQDLTLRHRVKDYRAGDLERLYAKLGVEEDFFVTYGFMTRAIQALMHPRSDTCVPAEKERTWPRARAKQAELLLHFVRERGAVHPREVDSHFSHGTVKNYWGGSSNATTQLLDAMHYRGLLRVARREAAYASTPQHGPGPANAVERRPDRPAGRCRRSYLRAVARCEPSVFVRQLRFAVPQWRDGLKSARASKKRLSLSYRWRDWYWPDERAVVRSTSQDTVRLLALLTWWGSRPLQLLWVGSTVSKPTHQRRNASGCALRCFGATGVGWGNISLKNGELQSVRYVDSRPPRDPVFKLNWQPS